MQKTNGMKTHKAQGAIKWSQLLVTHTMHDTSKKHNYSTNHIRCSVVNPIQTVQRTLNNFEKATECNNLIATLKKIWTLVMFTTL
jgi:hypothetical protein